MTHDLATAARSWLFVPATRPDRFAKATASGADIVIIDLEDAVPEEDKFAGRRRAATWLSDPGGVAAVRVNPVGSEHHGPDVDALIGMPGLRAVLIPMASSVDAIADLHRRFGNDVALVPQIETAAGLVQAVALGRAPGVVRLAFGHLDFALDIDAAPSMEALCWARSSLVVSSRAAGLAGPVDSVTTELDDPKTLQSASTHARALGFTGKLCVHPRQVDAVNGAMSPTADEVSWAERVLAAGTTGAGRMDSHMVDAPVVARAKRVLAQVRTAP